jgi:heptosyltransferase-2
LPFLFGGKEDFIALAPSAAWKMKRWPLSYWKKVIEFCPDKKFIVLGGPEDHFCQELEDLAPERVRNLAGKLNLIESCFAVSRSDMLISADTGLLHVADHMGKNTIALIGPTAFGHPSGPWVKVLETNLNCRPCTKDGRGHCKNKVYQSCLIQITPELVCQNIF